MERLLSLLQQVDYGEVELELQQVFYRLDAFRVTQPKQCPRTSGF